MSTYTLIHVAISLIAILSGIIVLFGMLGAKRMDALSALFLATTLATSLTGFGFPFKGVTPGIIIGIISVVLLLIAILARYRFHLNGIWSQVYAVTATIALYLNVFVLVVQLFMKVPALHALAPKGSEPPFAITQLVVLVIFIVLGIMATIRFRNV